MKKFIGSKIKEYRERLVPKMNQGRLGVVALNYSESESNAAQKKISKIEAGTIDITIDELLKITNVLHIPLSEIFNIEMREDNINRYSDPIHDDIELILSSGRQEAVSALKYGIKGVIFTLQADKELLNVIKQMADDIKDIKTYGAEKSATAAPNQK